MIKGIGIDIVEHDRVNLKLAKKILTEKELESFEKSNNQVEFLASRFAVKEAVIKATNKMYLIKDIEVTNDLSGMPKINIDNIMISLTHERKYSVAVAIWEENV